MGSVSIWSNFFFLLFKKNFFKYKLYIDYYIQTLGYEICSLLLLFYFFFHVTPIIDLVFERFEI